METAAPVPSFFSSVDSSPPRPRLEGKVALVTGGASGIGESIARLFHRHGAKICIIDVQDDRGQSLCGFLGGENHTCYIHGDVTIEDDIKRAVDFTIEKFGTVDIMVNNAGISETLIRDIRDFDLAEFKKVHEVNVNGTFLGMKHAAIAMIPRRKGSIVSIASVASVVGGVAPHGYAASKHAIVGLTQNVAVEMGNHGIRVNCVSPFVVPTNLSFDYLSPEQRMENAYGSILDIAERAANLKGASLLPNDVAEAVLFLASDESKYVSGHNLVVDGGFSSVNHGMCVFR